MRARVTPLGQEANTATLLRASAIVNQELAGALVISVRAATTA
jgi:hypothetical protein